MNTMISSRSIRQLRTVGSWSSSFPFGSLTVSGQRLKPPLVFQSRRNNHEAFPCNMTRLQSPTHHNIAAFIAVEDFVRDVTGYTFSNRHLLLIALYGNSTSAHPRQRLAFLGDGILKYLICEAWYETGGSTCKQVFTSRLVEVGANVR